MSKTIMSNSNTKLKGEEFSAKITIDLKNQDISHPFMDAYIKLYEYYYNRLSHTSYNSFFYKFNDYFYETMGLRIARIHPMALFGYDSNIALQYFEHARDCMTLISAGTPKFYKSSKKICEYLDKMYDQFINELK